MIRRRIQFGGRRVRKLAFVVATLLTTLAPTVGVAKPVDFSREVKPILARRCFACHGPDSGEGGLRLDRREHALSELDSGLLAIVP